MLNSTHLLISLNSEIFYVFHLWLLIFCLSINFVVTITVPFTLILIVSKYRIIFWGNLSTKASVEMVYIPFTVYLFLLDPQVHPFSPSARPACLQSVRSTSSLWHARFGHSQDKVLRHLLSNSISPSISIDSQFCKHCTQGKMTQLSFSHSNTSAYFPLQIVYSDVWGPAPITSLNGFRCYVSFIDAYSRFTWFFPLKNKSQVLSSFIHFKNIMENLLGSTIKIFRTDCGGEYSKNAFQSLCSSHGILHQFTCPHTSQQNGVAERKHQHIVDMALCLISHSSLPFTYWPYAFSTAVYLINRLPSITRNYVSPWEILFSHSPDYKSFKIFGCACYPLLRPYNSHKFNLRSTQCIFLGYATNAKGYLCLDPKSNRLYTSRHVVFDENTFPFSNISSISTPSSSSHHNSC
jgi:hypothetical protein